MGLETFSEHQFFFLRTGVNNPLTGSVVPVKGTIEDPKTITGVQITKSTGKTVLCDSNVSLMVQKQNHYVLDSTGMELRKVMSVSGQNITLQAGFTDDITSAEPLKIVEGGRYKKVKITNTHSSANASINGVAIKPGEIIEREFARGCAPVYYDATGGELLFELSE